MRANAKQEKITVELSNADRQLLRDIRDALRASGVPPEEATEENVKRLIEDTQGRLSLLVESPTEE